MTHAQRDAVMWRSHDSSKALLCRLPMAMQDLPVSLTYAAAA
ncbi:hypothetical protein [Paraburkholderia caffeinilytica]